MLSSFTPALLALANGAVFYGDSIGALGSTVGEVVFNTALTGYQEILTDPSYARQIVTLTAAHVGNTGINEEDIESSRIQTAGLVIRDMPMVPSNFRMQQTLAEYLCAQNIVAIAGVDTRRLTRILREQGAQSGCIVTGKDASAHAGQVVDRARSATKMQGSELVHAVSTSASYPWIQTEWQAGKGYGTFETPACHVVAFDYGIKLNTLRMLAQRGCRVSVVPAAATAADVWALAPDGIFLSNGPGDPQSCAPAIRTVRELIDRALPIFGLCLGHQLIALALGARTVKMKTGHHGANHPVRDLDTGRVVMTAQNHGFAVDADTLPANARVTHLSLFDGTLQGFELTDRPVFCFQGHPEASPGPHDAAYLFDRFLAAILKTAAKR